MSLTFDRKDAVAVAVVLVCLAALGIAGWMSNARGAAAAVVGALTLMLIGLLALMRRDRHARERAHQADTAQHEALVGQIDLRTRQLALSEARFRGVFESATDAILTVDSSQHVVMANPAAAHMLQLPQTELVGAPLDRFIPARSRDRHRAHITGFGAAAPTSRPMSPQREVAGLRADGSEFPIEAAISHLSAGGEQLYTVILRDITERKRADAQLRQMKHEVEGSHADLQRLVSRQDRVQEDERKRIARELHDDLQQKLAAILMNLSAAKHQLHQLRHVQQVQRTPATAAEEALDAADELAAAAIESTRRIVNDLRPQLLDDLGIAAALEALCAQLSRASGMRCTVRADSSACDRAAATPALATSLYRVAQESLNNVAKHAQAREVNVALSIDAADRLRLEVRDDGRGLEAGARGKAGAFGLRGMQERLRPFGGTLVVESPVGGGTVVVARVAPSPVIGSASHGSASHGSASHGSVSQGSASS